MGWMDGSLGLVEYRAPYGANKINHHHHQTIDPIGFRRKICIGSGFNLCEIRTRSGSQMVNMHKINGEIVEPFSDGEKCKINIELSESVF